MGLGQRILGGPHGHAPDGSGGHIRRPHLYELTGAVTLLGQRRRVYRGLAQLAGIVAGDRVLDIGCGTGYLTRQAAELTGPSGHVTGIDPSEPMIRYARGKSASPVEFVLAGAEKIPLPSASFDVAVSSLAVHHIPPSLRPAAMAEAFRLVRPGGRILVVDFRPPRNAAVNSLIGALSGHAMSHNPIGSLAGLISGAGFVVSAQYERWPMLHCVLAKRP